MNTVPSIKEMRDMLKMNQRQFAIYCLVCKKTVQEWEEQDTCSERYRKLIMYVLGLADDPYADKIKNIETAEDEDMLVSITPEEFYNIFQSARHETNDWGLPHESFAIEKIDWIERDTHKNEQWRRCNLVWHIQSLANITVKDVMEDMKMSIEEFADWCEESPEIINDWLQNNTCPQARIALMDIRAGQCRNVFRYNAYNKNNGKQYDIV